MRKEEFTNDLPDHVRCACCDRVIMSLEWGVGAYSATEWMGICVVKCPVCNWLKIAAAGSDEDSHKKAQYLRLELAVSMGMKPSFFVKNSINGLPN